MSDKHEHEQVECLLDSCQIKLIFCSGDFPHAIQSHCNQQQHQL